MLNTVNNSKKVSKSEEVGEANIKLELSPISLVIMSENGSAGIDFLTHLEFNMSDGSVLRYIDGPSKEGFIAGGLYGLISGMDGGKDEESGIDIEEYIFTAPLDIDEVEAITIDGVRFEF